MVEEIEVKIDVIKYYAIMILKGILIAVILAGLFFAGAAYSCNQGGGTLLSLECRNPQIIQIAEIDGNFYKMPSNIPECKCKEEQLPIIKLNPSE